MVSLVIGPGFDPQGAVETAGALQRVAKREKFPIHDEIQRHHPCHCERHSDDFAGARTAPRCHTAVGDPTDQDKPADQTQRPFQKRFAHQGRDQTHHQATQRAAGRHQQIVFS